jgi:CPA1 family monovalent cation:H+ antiporter
MPAFEAILLILVGAVALLRLAERIGVPYPALLAIAGAGIALLPFRMPLELDPDLALALFIAPVLLDAAYDTSIRDLKANWKPVMRLVVVAVVLTTAAVAFVAHWLVPGLPWAAAIALGAIVAPPDAAAATTVLRAVKLPHRLGVILSGESLLNDATSLLIYRLAVGAAMAGGSVGVGAIAPAFLVSVIGALVAGPALAFVWTRVIRTIDDAPSSIILQFVGAFGIWVAAEAVGLSPILTVVTFAMTTARSAPGTTPARLRVPSYAVWDTATVLLNALAFSLIGIQLGGTIADAGPGELLRWTTFSAAIVGVVVIVRLAWVLPLNIGFSRTLSPARRGEHRGGDPSWQSGLVVGWCGMRGLVTVATALALPGDFPERDLILFAAFAVTLGTLVLQGTTLRPLLLWLNLHDDEPVEREIRTARVALADAALARLDEEPDVPDDMRRLVEESRRIAQEAEEGDGRPVFAAKRLRARILAVERDRLLALREAGTIGDDAFHRLEEELDLAELAVGQRI